MSWLYVLSGTVSVGLLVYLIYALIEQNVAQDQLGLRLLAHGLLVPLALLAVGVLSYFEAWHRWICASWPTSTAPTPTACVTCWKDWMAVTSTATSASATLTRWT